MTALRLKNSSIVHAKIVSHTLLGVLQHLLEFVGAGHVAGLAKVPAVALTHLGLIIIIIKTYCNVTSDINGGGISLARNDVRPA